MGSPSTALEAGNQAFHEAYGGARDAVQDQVPVLVVLPTELALHNRGQRRAFPYTRPAFAQAKSAAHIAVALFALTCEESKGDQARAGIGRLLGHISAALEGAPQAKGEPVKQAIDELLERCQEFARAANEHTPSKQLREQFASDAGPRVLHITELATGEQIAGLHEAVELCFRALSSEDQAQLQVVVVGDHQARARSLGMQYFKRRLHEEPGRDQRVTYGENITEEEEALSLVATRRLDKRIARAFFGDENRLERDVLGDAATRCLDQMPFPP